MIDKYNTLDDLVAISLYSGEARVTHTTSKEEQGSGSWLSSHQQLRSVADFFGSQVTIAPKETNDISSPRSGNGNYFKQDSYPVNFARSASMMDMGVTNWKYIVENCK